MSYGRSDSEVSTKILSITYGPYTAQFHWLQTCSRVLVAAGLATFAFISCVSCDVSPTAAAEVSFLALSASKRLLSLSSAI